MDRTSKVLEFMSHRAYLAPVAMVVIKRAKLMANPVKFVEEVRSEIGKVAWPTRREVILTTVMVFIMAALMAVFFSLVDMVIRFGVGFLVG
ncbi:preprotein translocase subunit SecE [Albirhodobacter sp. R86504]|uniref:preprotein translocase subunit SecE n=1 Tax=Albirhodobacter sp. R86504 TaxID=3093848 RepID=UPI003670A021